MLPIYICEDDGAVLAAQKEYLEKQILIEGYDMEVALCSRHPEDILNAVKAAPRLGIYFLDVELKGEPMEALDYIVKGNPEKMYGGIRESLAAITERMGREQGEQTEYFTVKALDVVKHIPIDEIMFFETTGRTHRIELHGKYDRFDFIGSIQELETQLGSRFLRVHRAYLVNTGRIWELDLKHREILMENGEKCLFSRNAKAKLLQVVSCL